MNKFISYTLTIFNFGSDFGLGVISAIIITSLFGKEITTEILQISILFCLLPDIDMLVELPLRIVNKVNSDEIHRTFTHYPLIYTPIIFLVFYYSGFWGTLLTVNLGLHFLHDLLGTGWGLKLLWPITNKRYKLFASREDSVFSKNWLVSWNPEDHYKMVQKYHDPFWMENLYLNSIRNSWVVGKMKNINNRPSKEWLYYSYRKIRWFYYAEILITITGIILLLTIIRG